MIIKVKKREKPTIINYNDGEFSVEWEDELNPLNFTIHKGEVQDFDESKGVYPIVNEEGQVCKYLDLMGRITEKPLASSKAFADYLEDVTYLPYHETYKFKNKHTAVSKISVQYFNDEMFVAAVIEEERRRFDYMVKFHFFENSLKALIYKRYCKKQIALKVKEAKELRKERLKELASRIIIDRSVWNLNICSDFSF